MFKTFNFNKYSYNRKWIHCWNIYTIYDKYIIVECIC